MSGKGDTSSRALRPKERGGHRVPPLQLSPMLKRTQKLGLAPTLS